MKILICISTTILLFSTMAISQDLELIKVESNEIVELSADQSWRVVMDWKNLNQLVPEVVASTTVKGKGLGSSWQINLINGGSIKEEMIYFNSSERTMSYTMTETPMPIKDYTAIIKVEPYGISKSFISFYTECKATREQHKKIKNTFKTFQVTYLSNLKKHN